MGLGGSTLWSVEIWQKRILNLLIITIPIISYILFYTAISAQVSFSDLGLWLVIIISFLFLAHFGTFIPTSNRVSALGSIGMIMVINVPLIFLLEYLDVYKTGFWLVIGILCLYMGYTLIIDQKKLKDLYVGILSGTGLGIIIASFTYSTILLNQNLSGNSYFSIGIVILWLITGLYTLSQGFVNQGDSAESQIIGLQQAAPIFFGIFLIFFGIFLFRFGKIMETLVELFLGGVVILYGAKRIRSIQIQNLGITILLAFSLSLTLTYLFVI
jgi:hypothetical protein